MAGPLSNSSTGGGFVPAGAPIEYLALLYRRAYIVAPGAGPKPFHYKWVMDKLPDEVVAGWMSTCLTCCISVMSWRTRHRLTCRGGLPLLDCAPNSGQKSNWASFRPSPEQEPPKSLLLGIGVMT
ncbi:hypothetical protein L195_g034012 [Trifolium pratense]|uniref:Uncharacterized protein n=1 Tax=Trifolium pratense TaxID=57577 RepID=A0A2K3LHM4_TRIPR|nr:hypothetical protein L195_g034012 [Trifolium pratense]